MISATEMIRMADHSEEFETEVCFGVALFSVSTRRLYDEEYAVSDAGMVSVIVLGDAVEGDLFDTPIVLDYRASIALLGEDFEMATVSKLLEN